MNFSGASEYPIAASPNATAAAAMVTVPNPLTIPAIGVAIGASDTPAIFNNASAAFTATSLIVSKFEITSAAPANETVYLNKSSGILLFNPSITFPIASQVLTVSSRLRLLSTICCNHCTAPFKLSENPLTPFKTGPVNISPNTSLTENKRCSIKSH